MTPAADMIRDAREQAGLSQSELADLAGTSQPAVNRYERGRALPTLPTLERLLGACGRGLRLVSVRAVHPEVSSVRGLVGTRAGALRAARPLLLAAAQRHGVAHIRVFGSVARGEEDASSDLDLLVDLAHDKTLVDLSVFRREVSRLLGIRVDVATPDLLRPAMREEALREAVPL